MVYATVYAWCTLFKLYIMVYAWCTHGVHYGVQKTKVYTEMYTLNKCHVKKLAHLDLVAPPFVHHPLQDVGR